jgi:hypothetical protein
MEHVIETIISQTKTKSPLYKFTFFAPTAEYDCDNEIIQMSCEMKTIIYDFETYKENVYEEDQDTIEDHWSILTGKHALYPIRPRDVNADWLWKNDYKNELEVYCNLINVELLN